ncbi:MAG: DEAD/DEAH box helicase [Acholeplasmatales bacterium]|jgi:ATP-dependent RNA helicase CshB|nr:DEAD/DEAH box helicase [Acholeplasmatales bacterium]
MYNINDLMKKAKFDSLSDIQKEFIDNFLVNKHLVGVSKTGTGKTHAYLFPILASITNDSLETLIVVPTNELVFQITSMISNLELENINVLSITALTDRATVLRKIDNNTSSIIVTTPNKLKELVIDKKVLTLESIKYIVLDEADMMFDEAFLEEIDLLLEKVKDPKILLMSATITLNMSTFIKKYFGSYKLLDTTASTTLDIEYRLFRINAISRIDFLFRLLPLINPYLCLIFISNKDDVNTVYAKMVDNKYNVCKYSSDLSLRERKNLFLDIKNLKYQYVVTSDLFSRGIDIVASEIINYDFPNNFEFFMHRSGRTGRMKASGIVDIIASKTDSRNIEKLKNYKINYHDYQIKGDNIVKKERHVSAISSELQNEIKKIKKPTKVTPNYKKKNKEQIKEIKNKIVSKKIRKNRGWD